jgi:argininosuccinate synthase
MGSLLAAKGNDQARFEMAFYAIQASIKVIAPWRDPKFIERFNGRNDLLDYAAKTGIPVTATKSKPWSMDENMV